MIHRICPKCKSTFQLEVEACPKCLRQTAYKVRVKTPTGYLTRQTASKHEALRAEADFGRVKRTPRGRSLAIWGSGCVLWANLEPLSEPHFRPETELA